MKLVLFTYQKKEALDKLQSEGVLRLKKEDRNLTHLHRYDDNDYNHFEFPYKYMIHKMKEKLPPPKYDDTYYPIWAWQKVEGDEEPSEAFDKIHAGCYKLKLEIDDNRLLLSDFDMFSALIMGVRAFDKKEDEKIGNDTFDSFFHPSLEKMFTLHRKRNHYYGFSYKDETIQATFWELYLEDVIEIFEPCKGEQND